MFLLVPAYLACPGPKALKRLCVCVCVFVMYSLLHEVSVVSHFFVVICYICSYQMTQYRNAVQCHQLYLKMYVSFGMVGLSSIALF